MQAFMQDGSFRLFFPISLTHYLVNALFNFSSAANDGVRARMGGDYLIDKL